MDFPVVEQITVVAPVSTAYLEELKGYRSLSSEFEDELSSEGGIRAAAMRQEALRVGSQAGLSERYKTINSFLDANESRLNVTFNFAPVVNGRVLMPAIASLEDTFILDQATGRATVVQKSFSVLEEAKIISTAPTWREWLYQSYERPEMPHFSLLPKTKDEAVLWEQSVQEGWNIGVSMANQIFDDQLMDLTKTLEDRYRYKMLLSQNVVTAPVLNEEKAAITYNGRTLNVGEKIYSLSSPVTYTASSNWRPIWSK